MIKTTLITTSTRTTPDLVYTSSTTGETIGGPVTGQQTAVTTIALCNFTAQNPANESAGAVTVNIYLAKSGIGFKNYPADPTTNLIVSELIIPAGETVFFNDERIVLDSGDQIFVGTNVANTLAVTVSALIV